MARPDISFVAHCLSQFMHNPFQSHYKLVEHVLRYLKLSPGKGLTFVKSEHLNMCVNVDADWAKTIIYRKSVNGFCVFLGNSLVAWKSKKQNVDSRSSNESEYRAMSNATCDIMWI
ncbi:uncharacterized mitochondrial protein AtMg00810-like [Rutidosis leptorrhynchoides]|uniref:uncharacterized mitochondrial protein AtMg00810-like n=1 Tax=Rutidosis leptorrhynchoides TaxID=125765 RepID=UPI003A99FEE7